MTVRPKQRDCQFEPPYPDHDTVLFSIRFPEMVGHLASARCPIEEPHRIEECGEFEEIGGGTEPEGGTLGCARG